MCPKYSYDVVTAYRAGDRAMWLLWKFPLKVAQYWDHTKRIWGGQTCFFLREENLYDVP